MRVVTTIRVVHFEWHDYDPGGYSTYDIPYSVNRNTSFASYWVKQDVSKLHLGVQSVPLRDDLQRKLERNTGVVIAIPLQNLVSRMTASSR